MSVIANFYMEYFQKTALETAKHKRSIWFRYVDDIFVIWKLGKKNMDHFLEHLNKQHPNIQFTIETEEKGRLPSLDVLVIRSVEQIVHTIFRKPTHMHAHAYFLN